VKAADNASIAVSAGMQQQVFWDVFLSPFRISWSVFVIWGVIPCEKQQKPLMGG
jgi:hypothetical protein